MAWTQISVQRQRQNGLATVGTSLGQKLILQAWIHHEMRTSIFLFSLAPVILF